MSGRHTSTAELWQAYEKARQSGDQSGMVAALAAVLDQDPEDPQALNASGMILLADANYTGAADFFARATRADPEEPGLWMNLATAQRAMRDDYGELTSLGQALAANRHHFMAQLRMAELQQRTGQLAAATRSWQRVLALSIQLGDDIPPALETVLRAARAFVETRMADFSVTVDTGLDDVCAALAPVGRTRIQGAIDKMLGRRQIYHNECHGLHVPFLPADEFFDRAYFPWLDAIEAKADIIRAEFLNLYASSDRGAVRPYVRQDQGTPDNKWTPLDGSLDWGACFLWEYGIRNERVCALCPETAALLETLPRNRIPRRAPSAFFSLLRPHTHIPPHTGVTNSRAIVHLPLIVPDQCGFRVGGEMRSWNEGEAFVFDDTIEHEAWNDSDDLRVVLIFDVWNPHLSSAEQDALIQLFDVMDRSGHDPAG